LNTLNYLKEEGLINESTKIISLFYNPNIHPRSEYIERLNSLRSVIPLDVKIVIPDYKPKEYIKAITKKKRRCVGCWELRLGYLFKYAKQNNIKNITTTLLTSMYQDRDMILKIAADLNKNYSLNFINIDSKHNCNHKGFYKQNYCGCCFSLTEKFTENKHSLD
jgi:hypothetical protein